MTDEAIDQAQGQSISDRIANKFGFPGASEQEVAEDATESTQEPTGDDLADIEWEGLTFRAPTRVKEALMLNKDYTQKTQDLAEQRRTTDHVRELAQQRQLDAAFADSVSQEQQEVNVIDAYLQQASKLDWSAMNTDQILRQKLELDNIKERRAALRDVISDKRAKFNEEVGVKLKELRNKSRELASKSIQGFSEETEKAMRLYAIGEGLTEAEVDNVLLDPRSYKVVYKAMQFDKVQAGTLKAADSASKADRILKPGVAGNKMPAAVKARLDYGKAMKGANTSMEKARVIETRLAGVFHKGN
jgi:hypothetical protein